MATPGSDLENQNIQAMKQAADLGAGEPKQNGVAEGHVDIAMSNHVSEGKSSSHSSGDKSSDKHRSHSDKHRDKHGHSSSHKHKSSHGDKHRDHKSSSSSSHKHSSSSSSHKHRDSSSKHHSSSSSSKDKPSSSSSSSSKHRDGHSSSSSSKDKHHHSSSSKDKHHSSSSKHKDGSSSSKHHSSSSKHRDGEKSRDKDKERSHKDKHSSNKESSSDMVNNVQLKPESMNEEPLPATVTSETVFPAKVQSPVKIKEEKSPIKVQSPVKVKQENSYADSDDDVPLTERMAQVEKSRLKAEKRPLADSDEDDVPLSARMEQVKKKIKEEATPPKASPPKKRKAAEDDEDFKPDKKKKKKDKKVKQETPAAPAGKTPTKKGKAKKEEEVKWRWWEEERVDDGTKWKFLEHKGPVFAPPYERLPADVKFYYDGREISLSEETEEVAGFYARMIEHDYATKEVFNKNFLKDWRKVMTKEEREIITDISRCNFKEIHAFYQRQSEERKNRTKEEKQKLKAENEALIEEYGFCTIDKHREKIGNFRIEPPGLFRGRGDHPKMGMLKKRVVAGDIIINCSKNSQIPKAPDGHRWKEVRHDNTVTWLVSWTENIQGNTKYIMLNPASKLKGEKDWQKYETARKLHKLIDRIRAQYREDFKSKEMRVRQRAVALYFIDKLALRAGNEKDEDQADTVGCCSLRVEHIRLSEELDGKENVVEFDFLGKDSIRYYNRVSVEKRVFKNLQLFMDNKNEGDDVFDRLNTAILNKHLQSLMEGLTAKVFRTYNASRTLQEQLDLLTNPDDPPTAKLLSYNRANRAVAVLCNHQRAVPKNFSKQMENLQTKIDAKKDAIKDAKRDLKAAKADAKVMKTAKHKTIVDKKKKAVERLEEQLTKLEVQATDKDENKEIALGTSKLNYLDPRISVAWCKKWEVPIEKIYNKTQRMKFAWAIDMADEDYSF